MLFICFSFLATHFQLQRRNVSFVIPKKDDAKKRVLEQSQLLDGMLSDRYVSVLNTGV